MAKTGETVEEGFDFELYDFRFDRHYPAVREGMARGALPADTLLRLAAIGCASPDPRNHHRSWRWMLTGDIARNWKHPEAMRKDTLRLLLGPRPDVIVDWNSRYNADQYPKLDTMYYRMDNLATAIRNKRADQGQTVTQLPPGAYISLQDFEFRRCLGLARPTWRAIVNRFRPDIMHNAREYYEPIVTFNEVYYPGERTMQRRVVGHTVLSDGLMLQAYEEAKSTGIKGVGAGSRESLRLMLADEHPELLVGHELPADS